MNEPRLLTSSEMISEAVVNRMPVALRSHIPLIGAWDKHSPKDYLFLFQNIGIQHKCIVYFDDRHTYFSIMVALTQIGFQWRNLTNDVAPFWYTRDGGVLMANKNLITAGLHTRNLVEVFAPAVVEMLS
jgi:hypothetical protein